MIKNISFSGLSPVSQEILSPVSVQIDFIQIGPRLSICLWFAIIWGKENEIKNMKPGWAEYKLLALVSRAEEVPG